MWLHFIWKTIWVMRRAKSMYVYDVKTQKLRVRGTPRKCCSRSQQRSCPALQLRLTPLLVLIERVWWISHSLITSSALDIYYKAHSHTCGRRSCTPARYLSSGTHGPYFQTVSCNSSSSVVLNHYRTLRTKTKTWIQSVWFPKTMPWRKHNKLTHSDTAGIELLQHLQ